MGILRDNIYVLPQTSTEYATKRVEITEKRAPTDESVKILREMESEAKRQVDLAVHVGNTTFECVVHRMYDALSDCVRLKAVFKLNGVQRTAEHMFHPKSASGSSTIEETSKAMRDLRDKIATVIATEMIHSALDSGCLR